MEAIGFVNGTIEKGFVGQLKTLSIRAAIEIRPNRSKNGDVQPDYRVYSEGVEIGAGCGKVQFARYFLIEEVEVGEPCSAHARPENEVLSAGDVRPVRGFTITVEQRQLAFAAQSPECEHACFPGGNIYFIANILVFRACGNAETDA